MQDLPPLEAGTPPAAAAALPSEKKRRVFPIHPVLFVLFPYLAFYAQNFGKAPLQEIYAAVWKSLLYAGIVWLALYLITRQVRKSAVAASILILPFFAYGHMVALLPRSVQDSQKGMIVLGILGLCAMIALIAQVLRTRQPLYDANSGLNFMSVVLLLPSFWTILVDLSAQSGHTPFQEGKLTPTAAHKTIVANRHLSEAPQDVPDVYYIVLDAYGRADRLQTYYGYDNTPFLKELEKRGFFIATHSEANYDQTPLCLASALSMNYLSLPHGEDVTIPEILRKMVDDNAVINYLRPQGYHYIDVASGLQESQVETADMVLNDEPDLSIVEGQVTNLTAFGALAAHQRDRFDRHRRRLNGGFTGLETAAALPYPKFVFAHILAPHPPFVFDANGGPVNPRGVLNLSDASELLQQISKAEYRRGYVAQLQYINKRTLEAVDSILQHSKHKPIIIIQGDHGSRMNLDWESLAKTDLREPFSNLNAYLVPDSARKDLTDKITAVNSFRIILTDVFGAKNLPRLPDKNFYSTESHAYDFVDVTDRLNRMESASHPARYARGGVRRSPERTRVSAH